MDIINFLVLIAFIINISLTIFLLTRYLHSKSSSTLYFSSFAISVSMWCFAMFVFRGVDSVGASIEWARILYLIASFTPTTFFLFSMSFLDKKINRFWLMIAVIANITVAMTIYFTDFIENVEFPDKGEKIIDFGTYYFWLYINYIPLFFTLSFIILFLKFRKAKSTLYKRQLVFIIIGSFSTSNIAMVTNLLLPTLKIYTLNWLGQVSTIIWISAITYSIVKYRLFNIRVLIGRIVYGFTLSILLYLSFYFFINLNTRIFGDLYSIGAIIGGFVFSIFYSGALNYVNDFIRTKVQTSLINPGFDPGESINRFSTSLSTELEVKTLIDNTFKLFTTTIRPSNQVIAIHQEEIEIFKQNEINIDESDIYSIIKFFDVIGDVGIDFDNIEIQLQNEFKNHRTDVLHIQEIFSKTNIIYLIPIYLTVDNKCYGFIALGAKEGRYGFDSLELDFIEDAKRVLNVGLSRSFLYKNVKDLNENLQLKVDDATKELKIKNDQLAESLRKEKDMMDILGHELRTPLGTARNAIIMIDTFKKQGVLSEDKFAKYMDIAVENIRREKDLLETILQSARMENDRLQIHLEPVEVDDVINDSYNSFSDMAKEKKLDFRVENEVGQIRFNVDRTAIQQTLDNFTNNALKYTSSGEVAIFARFEDKDKTKLRLGVRDTGEGISDSDLRNIGKKFFRANPYLETGGMIGDQEIVRPGGTGIGMYVVKGLLAAMGSKLEIESELGKGSTFSAVFDVVINDTNSEKKKLNTKL